MLPRNFSFYCKYFHDLVNFLVTVCLFIFLDSYLLLSNTSPILFHLSLIKIVLYLFILSFTHISVFAPGPLSFYVYSKINTIKFRHFFKTIQPKLLHSKTPHVVTVLWLDSDDVVTTLSPTRNLVEGYKTVYLCHLDSYTVTVCNRYLVSSHVVTVSCLLGA